VKVPYSSLTAFLAHYRALKRAGKLMEDEHAQLGEMTRLIELLPPADREVIESSAAASTGRRGERALRNLQRLLTDREILSG